ncbi:toll/interleukin-1 receptor domain-containing protein [Nocardia asiatica]|uniref:toll/interleukin-1 receptor domain-containing protein n=1 Tax=Nocardia asiatica TaxID=209252 RepID=UPI0024586741|nr:toll/interleukin-1 receptor domain-containing protein [Nocardia asiatica]
MAHVFISHRTVDLPEAIRLADELKAHGHDVWLDDDQTAIGDSIIEKINDGLAREGNLVLCLSSSGVGPEEAPWTAREWMSTLARQLQGYDVRILPVRLTGGELPAIIQDLKCADLLLDWQQGMRDLIKALR